MMNNEIINSIREAEKKSHTEIYSTAKLFESGSWLQKPVKTVVDLLEYFKDYCKLDVLDLGCGVGRNCIPIARRFKDIDCNIDCIDILDFAIKELTKNSINYGVDKIINGIVSSIDDFKIAENCYDLIIAVSALEHINSEEAFIKKLKEIKNGMHLNGIVCLIVNSEITEIDKESGKALVPQFEVNLKTGELLDLLDSNFAGWEVMKSTVRRQRYDIPRENCISDLTTDVVTFAAKNISVCSH